MAKQHYRRLAADYPEYLELVELLRLAGHTWPRWGLSVSDLAQMDDTTRAMIRVALE
jgi:hypothetical protein